MSCFCLSHKREENFDGLRKEDIVVLIIYVRQLISLCVAYMRQWIGSALVQIMACRLFSAKWLSKPTVNWTLMNKLQWICFVKTVSFPLTKMHMKISSAKWRPFCPGGDELTHRAFDDETVFFHIWRPEKKGRCLEDGILQICLQFDSIFTEFVCVKLTTGHHGPPWPH